MSEGFIRLVDCDLYEPLEVEAAAEASGVRPTLISRLVRIGLLETIPCNEGGTLLHAGAILRLRRMQRLRRDLRVNFAGAAIIIDLVDRISWLNLELSETRWSFEDE